MRLHQSPAAFLSLRGLAHSESSASVVLCCLSITNKPTSYNLLCVGVLSLWAQTNWYPVHSACFIPVSLVSGVWKPRKGHPGNGKLEIMNSLDQIWWSDLGDNSKKDSKSLEALSLQEKRYYTYIMPATNDSKSVERSGEKRSVIVNGSYFNLTLFGSFLHWCEFSLS